MQSAWLEEAQTGINIAKENISNLRYAYDICIWLCLWQKVKKN